MASVDLRSDTVTKPGPGMRRAMAGAEGGDDVYGEDPSVNALQERSAALVGKQAALFVPSGTMANQLAIRAHTLHGDRVFAGRSNHIFEYESGAPAALSGALVEQAPSALFEAAELQRALRPPNVHNAPLTLVALENTHNRDGGSVFSFEAQQQILALAKQHGIATHLDGARVFNAAIACDRTVAELCADFDSVAFCFSKGLGAPVGSILCGSEALIERAHRFRKMFGGAMRQAGVLAAAADYALENNIERLAEDHAHARMLAEGIRDLPGVELSDLPQTNIVRFGGPGDAAGVSEKLARRGVLINPISPGELRAVTHLDISKGDVESAVQALRSVLA